MRLGVAAALLGALAMAGCTAQAYSCESAEQCNGGACQPTGFCSFPDPACESGQRYGEFSGRGLGGQCVEPTPGSSTGETDSTSTPAASSSSGMGQTSSGEDGTTVAISGGTDTGLPESTSTSTSTSTSSEAGSSSSGEPIDPTLIAWWRLDDDPADGVLDSTPNGLHGSCEVCPILIPGVVEGALDFTGDEVILVEQPDAFIADRFTVAAWVRIDFIDPAPSFHHFVGKPVGAGNRNTFELFLANTSEPLVRFAVANETTLSAVDVPVPPLEVWTHLAGTFDGDIISLYVDGMLVEEDIAPAGGIAWDDSPVVMGGDIDNGVLRSTLVGGLDEVRYYDRALDEAEIATLASGR